MSTKFSHSFFNQKTICKQFLREFGIARDWEKVKLAEMKAMLKGFDDERLFTAAKKIIEHEGGTFERSDFEEQFDGEDSSTDETVESVETKLDDADIEIVHENLPTVPTVPVAPAITAEHIVADVRSQIVTPTKPETKMEISQDAPQVAEIAKMLAMLMAANKPSIDPETVAAIANTVFDSKADTMGKALRDTMTDIANEAIKGVKPREIVIKQNGKSDVKIDGLQHFNFDTLLKACSASFNGIRLNVWLYGPPGTGKTTAAQNVAKALNLAFYCTGALQTKYEITGFVDAGGKLIRTPFREAWENGGIYLFDEIDGSHPNAIVAFNAALANGIMAFPDKMIERHPDCVVIAAANTTGMGATAEFNSRMKMDGASIDRFMFIEWPIDEQIETALSTNPRWAATVQRVRKNVAEKGVKGVFITPRATIYGNALLEAGLAIDTVKSMVLRKAMSAEQWAMVS